MPSPFEKYKSQVNEFNEKFGLSFSFDEYETAQLRLNNIEKSFPTKQKGAISHENNLYRGTLLNLYRESVENAIHKKSALVNQSELARSFNTLMNNYREYCKEKQRKAPNAHGGWKSGFEIIDAMRERISDIKPDKSDYIKDQYLAGKFPLRRMRAELETMSKSNPPSVEDLSKAIVYFKALEKTRKERTGGWKANPLNWVRNRAENRDLKALSDYINSMAELHHEVYDKAIDMAKENVIESAKQLLDKNVEDIKAQQQQREADKTKLNLNENLEIKNEEKQNLNENLEIKNEEKHNDKEIEQPVADVANEPAVNLSDNDYEAFLGDRMNSIIFENEVKAELSAIVKASGVRNESQVATISKNVCELYNDMLAIYDDYSLDNATEFMDVIIAVTFDESYRFMENTKLSVKDKLIAAQKMTNVMMKSYSPAALDNAKFGHYANNYVVGNEKIFEERLGSLELSTDVMPDVRKAFGVKIEKAPSNNNALEEQRKAEEEARLKAEKEEAQRKAEEEARLKAEREEAQRKAEEEAKKKAEEEENQRKALEEQKKLEKAKKAKKANSAPSLEDYFEKPRVDKTKGSTYVGAYEAWYEERRRDSELTKLFEAKCKEIIGIPETEANSKMLDKVIGIARGTWYTFCENIDRANKFNQTDERHHAAQDNDMRNSFLYGMQKLADLKEDISTKEACIIMTKLTDLAAKLYAPEEDLPDDSYKKYISCYMIDEGRLSGELWAFRNNGLNGEAYHKFIHEMAQELKEEFGMTKTSVSLPELSEAPKGATETSPKVEEIKANTKEKVVG